MKPPFYPTKPVQTRDGKFARIIATDVKGTRPVLALVTDEITERETAYFYYLDGRVNLSSEAKFDLVNVPERTYKYLNVYDANRPYGFYYLFPTATEAKIGATLNEVTPRQVKLTYEDGKLIAAELCSE